MLDSISALQPSLGNERGRLLGGGEWKKFKRLDKHRWQTPKNAFSQSPHCWKHAATVIANSLAEKYAALDLVVTPA